MKTSKINQELGQLGIDELRKKLDSLRRELFNVRLNASTAHVKDYSQFKKLQRDIARVLTHIQQKSSK